MHLPRICKHHPVYLVHNQFDLSCERSNTLEQILDVLRGSTIAEERGGNVQSKFWATYKKVSDEYDNDFLDRANDDMAIILTFVRLLQHISLQTYAQQVKSGWFVVSGLLYLHPRNET